MAVNTYSANVEEQRKQAALAAQRASEQRAEAEIAQAIANRDEKVVAGEDTERAATTAASLAKQQLGAAAGGGAAALAGMEAAQGARDKEFAGLLQNARTRKDTMEQKAVDRRQKAFGTAGQGSAMTQSANQNEAMGQYVDEEMAKRNQLQNVALATQSNPTAKTINSLLQRPDLTPQERALMQNYLNQIIQYQDVPPPSDENLKEQIVATGKGNNYGKPGKQSVPKLKKKAEDMFDDDLSGINEMLYERYR